MKTIIVMGVSGSGKSTVGRLLAQRCGGVFLDGDDFHPPENIAKMARGEALTDEDRESWLETLAGKIRNAKTLTVIACSALKARYRKTLGADLYLFLDGPFELLHERISARKDHYMPPALLRSQLETLEVPTDCLLLDIRKAPSELADQAVSYLCSFGESSTQT